MKHKLILCALFVFMASTSLNIYAEAPVVDLTNQSLEVDEQAPRTVPQIPHEKEPMDQRVLRLERQMSNINDANSTTKLEKIQQELQQLRGQLEVQNRDLTQLKDQVHTFYQDLDQRVMKMQPDSKNASEKTSSAITENNKKSISDSLAGSSENNKSKEMENYELAFNLLNKKDYEKAIGAFQNFIKTYPSSSYVVNAHYWLGEIYYLKNKSDQANQEFQIIVNQHPHSTRVPDALLKIALIAMDAGNETKAKEYLLKVVKQFPGTTAAKIATSRLKEIKQKK